MYSHDELVGRIKQQILHTRPELKNEKSIEDMKLIETITIELSGWCIDFTVCTTINDSNGEYELDCRYFSKIGKVIIFDFDIDPYFEDLDDLCEVLAVYQERITEFEETICLK